jgi:hypothetical protein
MPEENRDKPSENRCPKYSQNLAVKMTDKIDLRKKQHKRDIQ